MKEQRTGKICPKCGYHLLAWENNYIICLSSTCDWKIEAKRQEDNLIPDISNLKKDWA